MRTLRIDSASPFRRLIGVGGVGTGVFFKLSGDDTLGRNESRSGELLDVRDYCKLHITIHYVARILGAGNSKFGFEILPVARVGDDAPGKAVVREMQDVGIDTRFVETLTGKPTLFSVCFQYPDGSGGNITTNNSAAAELTNADIDRIREQFFFHPERTIALAMPEVPLSVRHYFLTLATAAGAFRVGSFVSGEITAARNSEMFRLLDLVAINESEAAELLGCDSSGIPLDSLARNCLSFLNDSYPKMRLIVSLGERGVLGFSDGQWNFCPATVVPVASTAGAGDALLAGVIAGLAAGLPFLRPGPPSSAESATLHSALELGLVLANYKVTSPHTIHPQACLDSLLTFMSTLGLRPDPLLERLCVESCVK
jgi:sugar/nucleoside kinase (ribokinase family)